MPKNYAEYYKNAKSYDVFPSAGVKKIQNNRRHDVYRPNSS